MRNFQKNLIFGTLFLVSAVQGLDDDDAFDDIPGFRFTIWTDLPASFQALATEAGYSPQSWNQIGSSVLESYAFDDINAEAKLALTQLGFTEDSWDCYINHYEAYSWAELAAEEMTVSAQVLGYDQASWDGEQGTPVEQKDWVNLSDGEKIAAAAFCYFADTWDDIPVHDMNRIPTPYPYFRYIEWADLPNAQRSLASGVGWTENTWNEPDGADFEYLSFSDMSDTQKEYLLEMGFSEETYDC